MVAKSAYTYSFLDGQKAMAHPSTSSSVSAYIRESFLVVAVGSTKRNLLDRLVHDQTLKIKNQISLVLILEF